MMINILQGTNRKPFRASDDGWADGLMGLVWFVFDSWLSGLLVTDESEGKCLAREETGLGYSVY